LEALILKGHFNHPCISWRRNTTGHKRSRKFLQSISDYFLTQATEDTMRGGAMLDLMLTNKEGLIGDVKAEGSLSCADHEMVEFKSPREASRAKSKLTTLDFRRADLTPLGICLEESHGIRRWREERSQ